jgi:fructokinase
VSARSSSRNAYRLGIDVGGTKLECALFDAEDRQLWRHRQPTPAGDYGATVSALAGLVQQARARLAVHAPDAHLTVGMGTPGSQAPDGRMKNCNSTCLNGQPLQADLQAAIGQPVRLANDANCLALSEATDGAGAGAQVVFAAILGTGTGAGIAVRGQLLTGPNGLAGEWGHNPLPWGEPGEDPPWHCYCGRMNCVESLLCGPGLARDHAQRHGGSLDAAAIARHAAAGDTACADTLQRHAHRLARALASVINLLDPDVIVLGGGLSRMAHLYTQVPTLWGQWVFSAGAQADVRTRLVAAQHGDASGVRGAAWLWQQPA